MVDRRVVQPTGLQLSNLAQPHITEVASPQSSHMAPAEPGAHESARPAVLLDEQSAATDPFFDFSGKPISYLNVGIGGGRGIDGEQFDTRVPGTVGQSSPAEDDKIVSSGADFHAASVDALIGSAPPLGLLGQEGRGGLGNSLADANGAGQAHHNVSAAVVVAPGSVVIPGPGGPATMVFEAGLGARPGEPAGSHPGQASFPVTTKVGTISFTSPDGVQTVSLGGHALTGTSQTFTDAIGSLTASFTFNAVTGKGTITYSYTLLDNTLGVPNANFAVVITDRDGDSNPPADLVIKIVDDAPIARADGDTIAPGQTTADGNVLTGAGTTAGAGTADVSGADGGLQVVGVAAGNGPGGAAPGTVGVAIAGAFGTLTLNADGSYTYVHTAGGGTETFTYTIRDADGSLAHATLTISLGDAAPNNFNIPAAGGAATTVFEAGLSARAGEPAGSHSGDPTFPTTTQSGTITFTSGTVVSATDLLFALLFIAVLFAIAGPLAWIPLVILPIMIVAGYLLQRPLNNAVRRLEVESSARHGVLVETLSSIETIRTVGAESRMQGLWEKSVAAAGRSSEDVQFWSTMSLTLAGTAQQFTSLLMMVIGVLLILDGRLSMGALIAANMLAGRVLAPISGIASVITRATQTFTSLRSINRLMLLERERPPGRNYLARQIRHGSIVFDGVRFKYPNAAMHALDNVSFSIAPGERVGIIGQIGSGKTTVGRLLTGLYEPDEGCILVEGVDLRQYEPADLRRGIGFVLQDIDLVFGKLRDNIALGLPAATDDQILEAARLAGVEQFAASHPLGYDMPIAEGGRSLSGGQKQAIGLARAMIRRPQILFLDEPTAHFDLRSEAEFLERLKVLARGDMTIIVSTHRTSLLALVDRLLVFEQGQLIGDGPRDQIIARLQAAARGPTYQPQALAETNATI